MVRIPASPIYDKALVKHAKSYERKLKDDNANLHPNLTIFKPGDSLTWTHDSPECIQHGHIGALFSLYSARIAKYNKHVGTEVFFIVANRGPSDTMNNHVVKYNARKIKRVTNPGGVKSFTIWRI